MNFYIKANDATREKGVAGNLVLNVVQQLDLGGVNYAKVETLANNGDKVTCTVPLSCLTMSDPDSN
jgi:hypothetical protein